MIFFSGDNNIVFFDCWYFIYTIKKYVDRKKNRNLKIKI